MAKLTTAEFIEAIKELSVLELNELVKACEEEFGVSAAAGVVVAAAGAAGGAARRTAPAVQALPGAAPSFSPPGPGLSPWAGLRPARTPIHPTGYHKTRHLTTGSSRKIKREK